MSYMRMKHLHGTTGGDETKKGLAHDRYWAAHPSGGPCPLLKLVKEEDTDGPVYHLQKCNGTIKSGAGGHATAHVTGQWLGKTGSPSTGFVVCCHNCNDHGKISVEGGIQFCIDKSGSFEIFDSAGYGKHDGKYAIDGTVRMATGKVDVKIKSSGAAGDWYYKAFK